MANYVKFILYFFLEEPKADKPLSLKVDFNAFNYKHEFLKILKFIKK